MSESNSFSALGQFIENGRLSEMEDTAFSNCNRLTTEEYERLAQKYLDEDDSPETFFISPLLSHEIIYGEGDVENYWKRRLPITIGYISSLTGLSYGRDFVLLDRGFFKLIVFLTKDDDGAWTVPLNAMKILRPKGFEFFEQKFDFYYHDTDMEFFPISAISLVDKNRPSTDSESEEFEIGKDILVDDVIVDISFLRSTSFHEYDSNEKREHSTYFIFRQAMLTALTLEHRIISFDDEEIDGFISKYADKICFRKNYGC